MNVRLHPLVTSALLGTVLAVAGWYAAFEPLTLARGGTLTIEGTSNVHGWSCTTGTFTGTADAGGATATGLTGLSALAVTVPVSAIECRNGTMNNKLREALQAPANPNVRFTLTNATVSTPRNGRFVVTANGTLAMAGQSRTAPVTAQGQVLADGRYRFTGSVPVTMSQWGIRPPTALMGTMHVGDRVNVRFDVTLAR